MSSAAHCRTVLTHGMPGSAQISPKPRPCVSCCRMRSASSACSGEGDRLRWKLLLVAERLAKRFGGDFLRGGIQIKSRHSGARSCANYDAQLRIGESITTTGIMDSGPAPQVGSCRPKAHPGMTVFVLAAASTQKPAAHVCGRVLGEAIHFEQNIIFDRTSQTKFEIFFHRVWKGSATETRFQARRAHRYRWAVVPRACQGSGGRDLHQSRKLPRRADHDPPL